MTINDFDGLHDVFNVHDIYGSNGWTWASSDTSASAGTSWEVTAYNGATMMAQFTINGTDVNAGAILV